MAKLTRDEYYAAKAGLTVEEYRSQRMARAQEVLKGFLSMMESTAAQSEAYEDAAGYRDLRISVDKKTANIAEDTGAGVPEITRATGRLPFSLN